jgi:hypothetical protein
LLQCCLTTAAPLSRATLRQRRAALQPPIDRDLHHPDRLGPSAIRWLPSKASTQTQRISGLTSQLPLARTPPQGPLRRFLGQFIEQDMPVELSAH